MLGAVCLFLLHGLSGLGLATAADADPWLAKAERLDLSRARPWQVLGHYRPVHGSWQSVIADRAFFLDPGGRSDPKAELQASIRGLFAPDAVGEEHAACRFPARAAWLAEALEIPPGDLPRPACVSNRELMERIAPHRAVLSFPAAAFQGLGAMFGHTLLRIDAKDKSPIISYAVSFAAAKEDAGFFGQVGTGLSGGFKGYFSLSPYYQKLNEYSKIEDRDVWEYPLDLNEKEVRMMALHAIELRGIATDYYFLDQNCALNLLFLIEAARPGLHLADAYWDRHSPWVVPTATIRLLWDEGVLGAPVYRPSLSRELDLLTRTSTGEVVERAVVLAAAERDGAGHPFLADGAARRLAAKAVQYRFSKLLMTQEEFQRRYGVLMAEPLSPPPTAASAPVPPHAGHAVGRAEVAVGVRRDASFLEAGWRPAYHDADDPGAGYPEGGTLDFLDLRGRLYPGSGALRLQKAEVAGFGSLQPANPFIGRSSWALHTGFDREYLVDGREHLLYYLDYGAGRSCRTGSSFLLYWLAKGKVITGAGLWTHVDLGPGIEAGVLQQSAGDWQWRLTGESEYFAVSEHAFSAKLTAGVGRKLGRNNSVTAGIELAETGRRGHSETFLRWQSYF